MVLIICLSFKLEKNKFHIQQLEGDVIKCREQIARSEEESRAAQRELKRLQMDSEDQRDALANEVRESKETKNKWSYKMVYSQFHKSGSCGTVNL